MRRLMIFILSAVLISFGCASAPEQETNQPQIINSDSSSKIKSSNNSGEPSLGYGESYIKIFQNCGVWDKDCIADFFETLSNVIEGYIEISSLNYQENDSIPGTSFNEWCRCEKNSWKWRTYSEYMFFKMCMKKAIKYRMEMENDYTCAMNSLRNYCDEYPGGEFVKVAEACIRQLDGDLRRIEKRGEIKLPVIMTSDPSASDKGPLVTILVKSVPATDNSATSSYEYSFVENNQTLDFKHLETRLIKLKHLAGRADSEGTSNLRINIYADRNAPARAIQDILEICRTHHAYKIAFVTALSEGGWERPEGLLKTYAPVPWPEDIPQVDLSQCWVDIYWTLKDSLKPPRIRHTSETLDVFSRVFEGGHLVVRCFNEQIPFLDCPEQTKPDYESLSKAMKRHMELYFKIKEGDKPYTLVFEPSELVPVGEVLKVVEAGKKAGITNFRFWAPLVDNDPLGDAEKPLLDEPAVPEEDWNSKK